MFVREDMPSNDGSFSRIGMADGIAKASGTAERACYFS
jgi:hypothetical protein